MKLQERQFHQQAGHYRTHDTVPATAVEEWPADKAIGCADQFGDFYFVATVLDLQPDGVARDQQYQIVTYSRLTTARNKGMVEWSPDAERRLANVPSGIRTMAKTELERTALDRGMPEVTVALMEEVKTRYFGMATGRS